MAKLESASPFVRIARRPATAVRLVGMPHPGGGASAYAWWADALPQWVEVAAVQLPGREDRIGEPPFQESPALVRSVADALQPFVDRPFALFGHSAGALLAFETARELHRIAGVRPVALLVSGEAAPHLPRDQAPLHTLPDDELGGQIGLRGGTPPELLANPELMELVLPTLRADLAAWETYEFVEGPRLTCPIVALAGADDPHVAVGAVDAWREHTTAEFRMHVLSGSHFYLADRREQVPEIVALELRELVAWVGWPGALQPPAPDPA